MKILITGAAGFIGYHLVKALSKTSIDIVGLDNINNYYDVGLKYGRLEDCGIPRESIMPSQLVSSKVFPNYRFLKLNLEDMEEMYRLFREEKFDCVCHLAAQAGVRYSLINPHAYISSNITGFLNILEASRQNNVGHLVYASSSSVYGLNKKMPFTTTQNVDHPLSVYASTKKSCELMAHTYSYLYQLPTTGLRFFTVYGPWGRPDMALFKFTQNIIEGKPIDIYNNGNMQRDFTYIDDIVGSIKRIVNKKPEADPNWDGLSPNPSSSIVPYKIYNIGNNNPAKLLHFIEAIEEVLDKKAQKNLKPLQPGDVPATWADCSDLEKDFNYKPSTPIKKGIESFIQWYLDYYK